MRGKFHSIVSTGSTGITYLVLMWEVFSITKLLSFGLETLYANNRKWAFHHIFTSWVPNFKSESLWSGGWWLCLLCGVQTSVWAIHLGRNQFDKSIVLTRTLSICTWTMTAGVFSLSSYISNILNLCFLEGSFTLSVWRHVILAGKHWEERIQTYLFLSLSLTLLSSHCSHAETGSTVTHGS